MAINENLHIICGRIGQTPELKYTSSGSAICNVSVATNRWDSSKKKEVTDWIRCIIIGRQAEYIGQRALKGSEIQLKGYVRTREYEDRNGQKRYVTETVCFDANLTGSQTSESKQAPSGRNEYAAVKGTGTGRPHTTGTSFDAMDDDLPW